MDQQTNTSTAEDPPLVTLFRHHLWANLRLIDACAALDEAQLSATTAGTYGAILDTLRHVVRSEQYYLMHLTGRRPEFLAQPDRPVELAGLREEARASGEGLIAYAATVGPGDLAYMDDDEDESLHWPIPAGYILTQVINHATEHRAQINTILTQQGIQPPNLSGWAYQEQAITLAPVPRPTPA
jgi:uncharacterized damage-inducible protein DinB